MAPALTEQNGHANGAANKANGKTDASRYHSSSSEQAMGDEARFAAHNYHPLPVVFAKASGCSVWDPEGMSTLREEREGD